VDLRARGLKGGPFLGPGGVYGVSGERLEGSRRASSRRSVTVKRETGSNWW
jgi:hypothetical protein